MSTGPHDGRSRDDAELVREARRDPGSPGSQAAAERLLARWQERVYAWCLRHTGDRERALDLTQDVLLDAWRGLARLERPERFAPWLFSMARFKCISEHRRRGPRWEPEEVLEGLADSADGPEQALARGARDARLHEAMERVLDGEERLALVLRYWEGLPVEEVTKVAKITGRTGARGVLQTARRKLRAALDSGSRRGG